MGKIKWETGKLLRNLVGESWVTDKEISTVFNIALLFVVIKYC